MTGDAGRRFLVAAVAERGMNAGLVNVRLFGVT